MIRNIVFISLVAFPLSGLAQEVNNEPGRSNLSSIQGKYYSLPDSLPRTKFTSKLANQKYDSIQKALGNQNKLTTLGDTIKKLVNKPAEVVNKTTDSLRQRISNYVDPKADSLQKKLNKPLDKINSKISSVTNPVEERVDSVSKVVGEKVNKAQAKVQHLVDTLTSGQLKAPLQNLDVPNLNIPLKSEGLPGVDLGNTNLPGGNVNLPNTPNNSLGIPGTDLNVDQLKGKANVKIPETDKLNEVKGKVGDVNSKASEVGQYEKDLQALKKGDSATVQQATKKAEQKIMNSKQVKGVEEQTQALTKQQLEYNTLVEQYKDQKLMKQEMARKAKNLANDKINQYTPEVKDGMAALDKAKTLESAKDILNTKNNRMAGKAIGQRLIPGITLQSYTRDIFTMDVGLQLGYRLTGRVRAGVGGLYRFGFSESYKTFVKGFNIYGGRTYGEFLIKKGIYVHAEYELLNATNRLNQTPEVEQIVSAGYFGLGKQFNISRKIKGHTLALYRVEFDGHLADQSKINLRLGFDLRTDKKRKKY
jgi:hypothetical protein